MLRLLLPKSCLPERRYTAQLFIEEWLGLQVNIAVGETPFAAELVLENGKFLRFEDHFFKQFGEEAPRFAAEQIPEQIEWAAKRQNPFLPEADLPILFGRNHIEIGDQGIHCGIDIIASAFFMLSRWEEYAIPDRDVHGRFPAKASLAFRAGFLYRPVVNELLEMLWAMLSHLGIAQTRKPQSYELMLTHDVDFPLLWNRPYDLLRKIGGSLLKRRSLSHAQYYFRNYFAVRAGQAKDPFDTFDYLMDKAEAINQQAHFFFLCGGVHRFDNPHPFPPHFSLQLLEKIKNRGHHIGFHPSYETIEKPDLFQRELELLRSAAGQPILHGRQHFLRFQAPHTWQQWEEAGLASDSTLYYAEAPGFRCGVCLPFPVFNFLNRQQLQLREIPLAAMEGSWINYQHSTPREMLTEASALLERVRKFQGTFALLWHNSMFLPEFQSYTPVFEALVGMHD